MRTTPEQNNIVEEEYFAFISYSTKDAAEASRLHHKLEYFKVTSSQALEKGWKRKPFIPTFFAPYEIQPAGLTEELKGRLRNSKHLIVVCSPNSAQSKWVQWEIEYFISLGRKDKIHFFIIDGIPNSENPATDCYGSAIKENGLSDILGANIHEKVFKLPYLNRERAYIQLITKLLDIGFDTVWQRHKRHMRIKLFSAILIIIMVLCSIFCAIHFSSSFDRNIHFTKAPAPNLYEGNGIIKIILDNDTITQKIDDTNLTYNIKNIPGKYRYKKVRCKFYMFGYNDIDTTVLLSSTDLEINIQRAPDIYGHIEGKLLRRDHDWTPVCGAKIIFRQTSAITDKKGCFSMDIPIDSQDSVYNAKIEYGDTIQQVELYPMRRNPNINNLIVLE